MAAIRRIAVWRILHWPSAEPEQTLALVLLAFGNQALLAALR
jgi:hypothetical protein